MRMDLGRFVRDLLALERRGIDIILVSSGAVAVGMTAVGDEERPESLSRLQALAAIGQTRLMGRYQEAMGAVGLKCAQVLLTHEALATRSHFLNIRDTLRELIASGWIPIVNENDTVATEELRFGDNDRLAAALGTVVDADLVILLSDVDALYDADPTVHPNAHRVGEISLDDPLLDSVSSESSSGVGTGGMSSKVAAARLSCDNGIGLIVANGDVQGILQAVVDEEDVGTYFVPRPEKQGSRRQWIGSLSKVCGRVEVDSGAEKALRGEGSSLLAVGITRVEGKFRRGDTVSIVNESGQEIGRGLIRYDNETLGEIRGLSTHAASKRLRSDVTEPVVHRNDLSVTAFN